MKTETSTPTVSISELLTRTGLTHDALAGQTAIVTGAGRGIGREAARALAWLGANVVIAELDSASGALKRRLADMNTRYCMACRKPLTRLHLR